MYKYRLLARKGQGTFSEVFMAQNVRTSQHVAIKCMKAHFVSLEQVNNLREIQALRKLSGHPHIVKLLEVIFDEPTGRLFLVFELMEMNVCELIKSRKHYMPENRVKVLMYKLLRALEHMHANKIFHRDVKPENVLVTDDVLKLADFGSTRAINSRPPFTEYISTRWYRPPECLLTNGFYNKKMDLWGVGCIFYEIMALSPLFPGENELDQVHKIHKVLGSPHPDVLTKFKASATQLDFIFPPIEGTGIDSLIPHVSPIGRDVIKKLLTYKWEDRPTATAILAHPYFKALREEPPKPPTPAPVRPKTKLPLILGIEARESLADREAKKAARQNSLYARATNLKLDGRTVRKLKFNSGVAAELSKFYISRDRRGLGSTLL